MLVNTSAPVQVYLTMKTIILAGFPEAMVKIINKYFIY